ncbi:unnamed protein product [Brachionus calyciflorus]|uniref:Endonuclease/exonuclease/phosphatase domain-containing protein n=1 Tax=Brachionus calyciflorus TaxID=104777 RepID=A0A814D301_9BILA|nr:unnamed protein product [Brachionus calyciflorus]
MWHYQKKDPKGEILESIINLHNLHVLNCPKYTFNRGKSVLDLSICSNSIRGYFKEHYLLDNEISDHQPTVTVFKNLHGEPKKFPFKKINWSKFYDKIANETRTNVELNNPTDLDKEIEKITQVIHKAIDDSTEIKTFVSKAINPRPIPKFLVEQIKLKRKIKRMKAKNNSLLLKKL